ncbi:PspA-associated protein PspAB [Halococcoides cellulosivorans]|uniref:Uncharacterized protein n=1 Tax=Halococcoides cellulosivorans TaxID=1679096 RepID=A0A2R4X1P1_9EURY|nr:hypothetical protein [Halococcoides cellulosivorans]AWB27716.1 hypothetical protein HARCEL1_08340 [Halococcoides cellulosivorans]
MGLIDGIRSALGIQAERSATRAADPEDLFGMSTAYLTMSADLDCPPVGQAALSFADVDSTEFADARRAVERVLDAGASETGTVATFHEDRHGYEWVVLEDDDFEDLVTSIHFAADTLIEEGFGSRLLAALFAFEAPDEGYAYWVYSFKRGAYYPFAPEPGARERDAAVEFKLQSVLDGELDVESDESYWYPLWPENAGHPWE